MLRAITKRWTTYIKHYYIFGITFSSRSLGTLKAFSAFLQLRSNVQVGWISRKDLSLEAFRIAYTKFSHYKATLMLQWKPLYNRNYFCFLLFIYKNCLQLYITLLNSSHFRFLPLKSNKVSTISDLSLKFSSLSTTWQLLEFNDNDRSPDCGILLYSYSAQFYSYLSWREKLAEMCGGMSASRTPPWIKLCANGSLSDSDARLQNVLCWN